MDNPFSTNTAERLIAVGDCPRCGYDHRNVKMVPLLNGDEFTHWATCPTTGQPLLRRRKSDAEAA